MATLFVPNPARRVTIAEILESYYTFSGEEGDDGKAAKYSLLPTGERANSVFLITTLTEVKTDDKFTVGTVNDKTGKIRIRASREYQPVVYNQLKDLTGNLPAHVAVTGRINVYEPEEKKEGSPDRFISIQPEGLAQIEKPYRDLWNEDVYSETVRRAEWNEEALTEDQAMAREIYGPELKTTILQRVKTAYQSADGAA